LLIGVLRMAAFFIDQVKERLRGVHLPTKVKTGDVQGDNGNGSYTGETGLLHAEKRYLIRRSRSGLLLAACRTIHEPAANPAVWPIFQLLLGP
jgi:hypothetical protein